MKKINTADKSETFLHPLLQESYHSHTGAVEESLKKFVEPCKIKELAKTGSVKILDMFFGMGYNSSMAVSVALKENPDCVVEVIGVENDSKIVEKIQSVNPDIHFFNNYKKITKNNLSFTTGNVTVTLLLGDAQEQVKHLQDSHFDAIFYDPFSPKKQPEVWSKELFAEMARVMERTAILATYSCARMVRENMAAAGLFWNDGPKVGRRGPGTVATKWA